MPAARHTDCRPQAWKSRQRPMPRRFRRPQSDAQGHVSNQKKQDSARPFHLHIGARHVVARGLWAQTGRAATRSEEHTSELQSLMRISYAVFCLKKKKSNPTIHNITIINTHICKQSI